jgi:hypothetical protein
VYTFFVFTLLLPFSDTSPLPLVPTPCYLTQINLNIQNETSHFKEFREKYFFNYPRDNWLLVTKLKKWLSRDARSRSLCNKAINH